MEANMSEWRMRPPPTLQGALTCWAAAISSFGRVTRGVPDWASPEAVVKHFAADATLKAELNADGSLKAPSGYIAFAKAFDLKIEEIRINNPLTGAGIATSKITSKVSNDLAPEHFVGKLQKSHVLTVIGIADSSALSHAVVVYGADRFRLCYMDPIFDPSRPLTDLRPAGGSGRVDKNWFCDDYNDFPSGTAPPPPRYLLVWRD